MSFSSRAGVCLLTGAVLAGAAGCSADETLPPTVACPPSPPTTQPPSGFPGDPGILSLGTSLPPGPFHEAPHRGVPPFVVQSPRVLQNPKLVTIASVDDNVAPLLFAFSDAMPSSAWWTAVSGEYGVGALRAGPHVTGPSMPGPMNGTQMIAYVTHAIEGLGAAAAPDGNTIFLLYLPSGITAVDDNEENCGCSFEAGAHFRFGGGNAIAFVQRCGGSVESLTVAASHEVVESATDPDIGGGYVITPGTPPWTGSVWASIQPGADELGDMCTSTRVHEGSWEYQRSFSNARAMLGDDPCAPALSEPYYNVSVDLDWYAMQAGGTVSVDVHGWANAPREDWFVYPRIATANHAGFLTTITSDESASANGTAFYGINNGKTATLTVTAPPDAPSGSYAVLRLYSRPSAAGSDVLHFWPVGFYVP